MSRAFTKEIDDGPEQDLAAGSRANELPLTAKNYTTPQGRDRLADELAWLTQQERPETARLSALAAATSQNLDLQTHKKRLREIDWRIQYVQQRLERAEVIDPAKRPPTEKIYFGATVTLLRRGAEQTISIVGVEEADVANSLFSFVSPLAKALLGASEGDTVTFQTPGGVEDLEILAVRYLPLATGAFSPQQTR